MLTTGSSDDIQIATNYFKQADNLLPHKQIIAHLLKVHIIKIAINTRVQETLGLQILLLIILT